MTKVQLSVLVRLLVHILLGFLSIQPAEAQYRLILKCPDKDALCLEEISVGPVAFKSTTSCEDYLTEFIGQMRAKGYLGASIDTLLWQGDTATALLFLGPKVLNTKLKFDSLTEPLLLKAGYSIEKISGRLLDMGQIKNLQENLLGRLEEEGYPFSGVRLDSIQLEEGVFSAHLVVDRGPLYKIDSISNLGTVNLSRVFLQRYLDIAPGSIYKRSTLAAISSRIGQLSFVKEQQPWSLTRLGTGAIVNVYLVPQKSNQINVLLGLLPSNSFVANSYEAPRAKLQLTGEATVNLKNALGKGETIGLNWQQLQLNSPRLNLLYDQSFLWGSPFGIRFQFDLFKKDTSFVTINLQVGSSFKLGTGKSGTLFLQRQSSNLVAVDTGAVSKFRQLPSAADLQLTSLGVQLEGYTTNYRLNPVRGNEWQLHLTAGTRTIKKNNGILKLKDQQDPDFDYSKLYDSLQLNSYQFRVRSSAAHFFPLTGVSTLRIGVDAGWVYSPRLFRNELFQIGGYKLLRGFDEESIYASQYLVSGLEYRYLVGRNSRFYAFLDAGWVRNSATVQLATTKYLSAGLGMTLETKGGVFNIAVAAGKRSDLDLSLKQAKLHFGYVNYF
jgi:outer membrane protein assembly factor BamA